MIRTTVSSPEKIRNEVIEQIRKDRKIGGSRITIEVSGTKVTLRGSVDTYVARRSAEADAAVVPSVTDVDNRLLVKHPETKVVPDAELRQKVKDSFLRTSMDTSKIKVTVNKGIVFLEGFIDSYLHKQRLQELTENIKGVIDVNNAVAVRPLKPFADDLIRENVILDIEKSLQFIPHSIEVIVSDGVVTLAGTVPDLSAYRAAGYTAYYTDGVVSVINDLIVEPAQE